ncbi:MAG: LysR family transcriptional regulator, partial [Giesbergeria sp.]|nr:LysR family transcriptional regulator [Giesbergeria sp.]
MDFVALEIFCAVAAEGSVTRAAQRLQRVQSNVTTRVRQLEDAVGCTLFLREGKRMALTPEGQTLLAYAQRLLALAEEARQALQPSQPQGRLRLGAMESTAASRLPGPLAQFHGQWPGVALELSTGASQGLLDRLRAHTLDAVLIAWP